MKGVTAHVLLYQFPLLYDHADSSIIQEVEQKNFNEQEKLQSTILQGWCVMSLQTVCCSTNCKALVSVAAGSRLTARAKAQNSSTVGLPCLPSCKSISLGALTPIVRDISLRLGGDCISSHAFTTNRISCKSKLLHLLTGRVMGYQCLLSVSRRNCSMKVKVSENWKYMANASSSSVFQPLRPLTRSLIYALERLSTFVNCASLMLACAITWRIPRAICLVNADVSGISDFLTMQSTIPYLRNMTVFTTLDSQMRIDKLKKQ